MTDFGGYRAMFLDFGVDPECVGRMSLGSLSSMLDAMGKRRGEASIPDEETRNKALVSFLSDVSSDPNVRVQ